MLLAPVADNVVFLVAGLVVFIVVLLSLLLPPAFVIPGSLSDVCVLLFDYGGLLSGPALVLYWVCFSKICFVLVLMDHVISPAATRLTKEVSRGVG